MTEIWKRSLQVSSKVLLYKVLPIVPRGCKSQLLIFHPILAVLLNHKELLADREHPQLVLLVDQRELASLGVVIRPSPLVGLTETHRAAIDPIYTIHVYIVDQILDNVLVEDSNRSVEEVGQPLLVHADHHVLGLLGLTHHHLVVLQNHVALQAVVQREEHTIVVALYLHPCEKD